MEAWFLLEHGAQAPAWNMACDEWLLKHAGQFAHPILRTYAWDRPSITIGYFQPFPTVHPRHAVIRRPTGGALVIHDSDLTFTVVLPPAHPWRALPVQERYEKIHERIQRAIQLRGREGSTADLSRIHPAPFGRSAADSRCFEKISRYDVVLDTVKVAGGAQRVTKTGLLHQGSIQIPEEGILSSDLIKAWETFGSRFQNLFLPDGKMEAIASLAREKYDTPQWNRRTSSHSPDLIPDKTADRMARSEPQPVS